MRICLDTNRYTGFMRNEPDVVDTIRRADRILLPFPVVAELRAGFLCGDRAQKNERNLIRFLNSTRVEVLYPDDGTVHLYARLFAQLRRQGTPIPTNDIWIAALALQHDAVLYARDRHFDHFAQIPRL